MREMVEEEIEGGGKRGGDVVKERERGKEILMMGMKMAVSRNISREIYNTRDSQRWTQHKDINAKIDSLFLRLTLS